MLLTSRSGENVLEGALLRCGAESELSSELSLLQFKIVFLYYLKYVYHHMRKQDNMCKKKRVQLNNNNNNTNDSSFLLTNGCVGVGVVLMGAAAEHRIPNHAKKTVRRKAPWYGQHHAGACVQLVLLLLLPKEVAP